MFSFAFMVGRLTGIFFLFATDMQGFSENVNLFFIIGISANDVSAFYIQIQYISAFHVDLITPMPNNVQYFIMQLFIP